MKLYNINYQGYTTKGLYKGYPCYKGDYVIFEGVNSAKDFKLNAIFYKGYKVENNIIYIM